MLLRVECEKPVVAGLNGVAVASSVAGDGGRHAIAAHGSLPSGLCTCGRHPTAATWTVTQALGYERAMRFFEQRMVHADEALRIGLIGWVADSDDARRALLAYGQLLAGVVPRFPTTTTGRTGLATVRSARAPARDPMAPAWACARGHAAIAYDGWGRAVVPGR
jgi:enoyl-CoA hydratase/carnithine racemase